MKRFAFLFALVALIPAAKAQDSVTDTRLALTKALVTTLKHSRRVEMDLTWKYTSHAPGIAEARSYLDLDWEGARNQLWGSWRIPNSAFASDAALDKWFNGLKDAKDRAFLLQALRMGSTNPFSFPSSGTQLVNLTGSLQSESLGSKRRGSTRLEMALMAGLQATAEETKAAGSTLWGETSGFSEFEERSPETFLPLTPVARYAAQLSALAALFSSAGAGLTMEIDPQSVTNATNEEVAKIRGGQKKRFSDEIVWIIEAVRSSVGSNGSGGFRSTYSFEVKAEVRGIKFTIQSMQALPKAIPFAAVCGLTHYVTPYGLDKEVRMVLPWTIGSGMGSVDNLLPVGADPTVDPPDPDDLDTSLSPSSLVGILGAVGGVTLDQALPALLLSGNGDADLIAGGLVGNGKPDRVIGANYIWQDTAKYALGWTLGLVQNRDSDLYIGPTVQAGPFTFGVGARVFEGSNDRTTARLAGIFGVDLSSLFSRKPDPIPLTFDKTKGQNGFWDWVPNQFLSPSYTFEFQTTLPAGSSVVKLQSLDGAKTFFTGKIYAGSRFYRVKMNLPAGDYRLAINEVPSTVLNVYDHRFRDPSDPASGHLEPIPDRLGAPDQIFTFTLDADEEPESVLRQYEIVFAVSS